MPDSMKLDPGNEYDVLVNKGRGKYSACKGSFGPNDFASERPLLNKQLKRETTLAAKAIRIQAEPFPSFKHSLPPSVTVISATTVSI